MADFKMEKRQLATAVSDLVLCVASIYSINITKDDSYYIKIGFLIFAIASGLGTIRFSVLFPHYQGPISELHQYFSFLASTSGLSLLAASYWKQTHYEWVNILFVAMTIFGPVLHGSGFLKEHLIRDVGSTFSVLSILIVSFMSRESKINVSAFCGSFLFILSAAVIGAKGKTFFGLSTVDWFHYILAVAVLALANGL